MARRTKTIGAFELAGISYELEARECSFRIVKPLLAADRERVEAADRARDSGREVPETETDSLSEALALRAVYVAGSDEPVGDKLLDLSFGDWQSITDAVAEVHGLRTVAQLVTRLEELRNSNQSPRDSADGGGGALGESAA